MVSDQVLMFLATVVANAAATWGVVSTKLAWLKRDVDDHEDRLRELEGKPRRKAST